MLNPIKGLIISSATAQVAPDQLKALAILSDGTVSWSRRPETMLEIRKKASFLKVISNTIIYKFFQDLTDHRNHHNHHRNTIRTWHPWQIKVGYDLLNQLGSYMKIKQFYFSPRKKNWLREVWVVKISVLRIFFSKRFASSEPQDNTSGSLNRGGIADLPLLGTLFAVLQKSQEPSFWKVTASFVLLA